MNVLNLWESRFRLVSGETRVKMQMTSLRVRQFLLSLFVLTCLACGGSAVLTVPRIEFIAPAIKIVKQGEAVTAQLSWNGFPLGTSTFIYDANVFEPVADFERTERTGFRFVEFRAKTNAPLGNTTIQTDPGDPNSFTVQVVAGNVPASEAFLGSPLDVQPVGGSFTINLNLKTADAALQLWDLSTTSPLRINASNPLQVGIGATTWPISLVSDEPTIRSLHANRAAGALILSYTVFCTPIGADALKGFSGMVKEGGADLGTLSIQFSRRTDVFGTNQAHSRLLLDFNLAIPGSNVDEQFIVDSLPMLLSSGGESYTVFITDWLPNQLTGQLHIGSTDPVRVLDFILTAP